MEFPPTLIRIAILFVATLALHAQAADRKEWEQHSHCRYIEKKYNDGDSFRVSCGVKEHILRLYYVDAPEAEMSSAARVGEQRAYFGVTIEDVLSTGEAATRRVRELLKEPFSVSTKWSVAGGRSKEPRYYGLIDVGGRRLVEILVSEGLARTKGVVVNLPSGERATAYLAKLHGLEREARIQRKGIWAHSRMQ
jgi:endonuclease YncB( thermonuclease family)